MNLYFFGVMKNGQTFPSKVSHFQYDDRFLLVEEWGTVEVQGGKTAPLSILFQAINSLEHI